MANHLNPITFPLRGASLIEASAGTGKTYTITNLFLRLVLGHKCTPQPVNKILLVTFTNAATSELRQRIRNKLQEALLAFYAGSSEDSMIGALIESTANQELSILRLSVAQKELDKATIYTIHGFCQRVLQEHAFESGMRYQQKFILDESEYLQIAIQDFWRSHIANLAQPFLDFVLSIWREPVQLLNEVKPWLMADMAPSHHIETLNRLDLNGLLSEYVDEVENVKRWWLDSGMSQCLSETKLHARHLVSKVEVRDALEAFCHSKKHTFTFKTQGWDVFSSEKVTKALTKASADFDVKPFEKFDRLQRMQHQCETLIHVLTIQQAISDVKRRLKQQKNEHGLLSPDDLLTEMRKALVLNDSFKISTFKAAMLEQYPIAIIDEFQDTDPVQYEIFSSIYLQTKNDALNDDNAFIMIGDPKQAIYAFRGADIYTYIAAKNDVDEEQQFTLDTNWRSHPDMVSAVNQLFASANRPFLLSDNIEFEPVHAGKNVGSLTIDGKTESALRFMTLVQEDADIDKPIAWGDASQHLAQIAANQISEWLWLSCEGKVHVNDRSVCAADICILVRDRSEADLMQRWLKQCQVNSVFLVRKSVFATQVAIDLFLILKGIHECENESSVKSALLTSLIGMKGEALDALLADDVQWQQLMLLVGHWRNNWQYGSLMQAVNNVVAYFDVGEHLIGHFEDGSRRLTDLRHLTELLQQQSSLIQGETQLLRWFQEQIDEPDHNSDAQQLRLDSDANLVKIVTLHSSKGLEYPIVFMPFACRFKAAKTAIYHDEERQLRADYSHSEQALMLADRERLAEDLRLLYVGLTRSQYHCSVGVWHANEGARSKASAFHKSALGYLLSANQRQVEDSEKGIGYIVRQSLLNLNNAEHTDVIDFKLNGTFDTTGKYSVVSNEEIAQEVPLSMAQLTKPIIQSWQMTSYSALSKQQGRFGHLSVADTNELDTLKLDEGISYAPVAPNESLDKYNFPRGASAGSFLHGVLEQLRFDELTHLDELIEQQRQWYGIDEKWVPFLHEWIPSIVDCVLLPKTGHQLSTLTPRQYLPEMEFYLPLNHVKAQTFNQIINEKTHWVKRQYQFSELNGILKGFIDLIYEVDGCYYVADYKSNYLGASSDEYAPEYLEQAMIEHDYHLQAIIYTLALHRWLKQRIVNYDYECHVGGALYLFLRGMEKEVPGSGVYHFKADKALIQALDNLFNDGSRIDSQQSSYRMPASAHQLGLDFGMDQ